MPIQLVVGLGNPGPQYNSTRHNVGFRVLNNLGTDTWKNWKNLGLHSVVTWDGKMVRLATPTTYMNLSGDFVRNFSEFLQIAPQDILVCYDDFALPISVIRLRLKGSAGGHNGMQSIIDNLRTDEIPRLRIGIGPLPVNIDPAKFVLQRMSQEENASLAFGFQNAVDAIKMAVLYDVETAMNKYNSIKAPEIDFE